MLYPTWLSAMATMRWGTLKPARVASLGTGKESVFPNTLCRVTTRMITTAPAPRMSPNRRSDLPGRRDRTALALRISELEEGSTAKDGRCGARQRVRPNRAHGMIGDRTRPGSVIERLADMSFVPVELLSSHSGSAHDVQAARRRTSQTVTAMSSTDSASSQPPSIHWNGQNRLAGW